MVVAAVPFLRHGAAAEFAAPEHERLVQQAAALQVGQQAGDRLVDRGAACRQLGADAGVVVPARRAEDLHEAHAAFDQPPGQQALLAERCGARFVEAVQPLDGRRLRVDVEGLGRLHLHAKRQFERGDPRVEAAVALALVPVQLVELPDEVELATLRRPPKAAGWRGWRSAASGRRRASPGRPPEESSTPRARRPGRPGPMATKPGRFWFSLPSP